MLKIYCISILLFTIIATEAQITKPKIAVFSNLMLDSFQNSKIHESAITGVEFLLGFEIAVEQLSEDSLQTYDIEIFDNRTSNYTIKELIKQNKLKKFDLIIGNVKNQEFKDLSDFANENKIPFISATSANDQQIEASPYTIIMNSTLKTIINSVCKKLQENHLNDNIIILTKSGKGEEKILEYFNSFNENKLKFSICNLDTLKNYSKILPLLSKDKNNVFMAASLNEEFALKMVGLTEELRGYKKTIYGMPNWDLIKNFYNSKKYSNASFYIPTPYFVDKSKNSSNEFYKTYEDNFIEDAPTSFAIRGYDAAIKFLPIILKYGKAEFFKNINNTAKTILNYSIQPNSNGKGINYMENKHIYFTRFYNGELSKVFEAH